MIRIEIGQMPPLLRSIVRAALESQEDFAIVEVPQTWADDGDSADVIIVSGDPQRLGRVPMVPFIAENSPGLIAIAADGHSAAIVRVTAENSRVEAASDLSALVRRAARDRRKAVH
jgi:inorganic pyrophosphatase